MPPRPRRLLLLAALASACGGDPPAPAPARWQVAGGFLRDPAGRAAILRGMNVSSVHKRAPYFDFHELPDYQRIRAAWGMGSVRFLVEWAAVEPARGEYDDAYLDEVARRVAWAEEAGLLVVLDMHQDLYGEGFGGDGAPRWSCDEAHYAAFEPTEPWFLNYQNEHVIACFDALWASTELRDHYAEAWRRVAARLHGSPALIGFDPMNEPHWGSASVWDFEEQELRPFYEAAVIAVRGEAPDWIAFLEPASSSNLGFSTGFTPFDVPDVVYAPHVYDSGAEQGDGFSPERRAALLDHVALVAGEARMLGAALWLGEYGGDADQPGIVDYMDALYDGAGEAAAGAMYWHYGKDDGYGVLRPDGSEKTTLADAIARPYPERVAGDPVRWTFDPEARVFTFSWRPDRALDAPTRIAVPARVWPEGYRVDCGGCEVVMDAGGASLLAPPEGDVVEIRIEAAALRTGP
jgi:endoglycosylceramidase